MKNLKHLPEWLFLSAVIVCFIIFFSFRNKERTSSSSLGEIAMTGQMQEERAVHAATLLPDGKVLVTGGFGNGEKFKSTTELYDPVTNGFTLTGKMHVPRAGHQAVLLKNGKVLILGGTVDDTGKHSKTAELYDPVTGTFTLSGSMQSARMSCSTTLLPDGKVLVAGGLAGREPLTSLEIYDPSSGSFTPAGDMQVIKGTNTALLMKNGNVLLIGSNFEGEMYDPASGTSQALKSNPESQVKYKYSATLLNNGQVLFTGGSDTRDWEGKFATAMMYDPLKGKYIPTGNMHSPRFKHGNAVVLLENGNVLVAGGGKFAELFDPVACEFAEVPGSFNKTLQFATATLLQDNKVLITGGYEMNIICTKEAWLYSSR
jgi:hypothetical protein